MFSTKLKRDLKTESLSFCSANNALALCQNTEAFDIKAHRTWKQLNATICWLFGHMGSVKQLICEQTWLWRQFISWTSRLGYMLYFPSHLGHASVLHQAISCENCQVALMVSQVRQHRQKCSSPPRNFNHWPWSYTNIY